MEKINQAISRAEQNFTDKMTALGRAMFNMEFRRHPDSESIVHQCLHEAKEAEDHWSDLSNLADDYKRLILGAA